MDDQAKIARVSVELGRGAGESAHVSLQLRPEEEPTILLGPNGCGKTTLLTSLAYLSLGNIATALEPPVSSLAIELTNGTVTSFRRAEQDRVFYSAALVDGERPSGEDEVVRVTAKSNGLANLEHDYDWELAYDERQGWETQLERVSGLVDVPSDAQPVNTWPYLHAESLKALLDWATEYGTVIRPQLLSLITSMLAAGSPFDFQSSAVSAVPPWLTGILGACPMRMLGVYRLGVAPSRWMRGPGGEKQAPANTVAYIRSDLSNCQNLYSQLTDSLAEGNPAWGALSLCTDGLPDAEEVFERLVGSPDDLPWAERYQLFCDYLGRYIQVHGVEIVDVAGSRIERRNLPYVRAHNLSAGQQQVLCMFYAVAFAAPPGSLVLIDEPELSLHVAWQLSIARDLAELAAARGCRVVLATHSPAVVNDWWEHVVEIDEEEVIGTTGNDGEAR